MACKTAWWGLCKEKPCGRVQSKAECAERHGGCGDTVSGAALMLSKISSTERGAIR